MTPFDDTDIADEPSFPWLRWQSPETYDDADDWTTKQPPLREELQVRFDRLPKDILENFGADHTQRNGSARDMVAIRLSQLRAGGFTLSEAIEMAPTWPHSLGILGRQSAEVFKEIWEARDKAEAKAKAGQRILTGAAFMARHVPPVWLIDGIVQRGRLYACTSLTGHGKTAVWLYNACMIHAGLPIGNLDVFKGNVLILAGENPSDLEARMIGIDQELNLGQLPYVLPGSFPLTDEGAEALRQDMYRLGVPLALIVGDTASSFFPGDDENSNVQSGGYARTLRRLTIECPGSPALVALSHPVKNASAGNLLPRGGGAFLNELDGNLTLWSEVKGEATQLHWQGKIRGPDFSPFGYSLRTVYHRAG